VFTSLPFRGDVGRTSNITLIRPDVTKRFQEVKSLRKELLAGLSTAGRQSELSSGNLLGRARMES
jgi:hypothetical protein